MRKENNHRVLEPFLQFESCDWGDTLRFKEDILEMVENSQAFEAFYHLLQDLEGCQGKPLILRPESDCFSPERCRCLVKHLGDLQRKKLDSVFSCLPLSDVTVLREESFYGRFIHWLRSVKRPVIMVYQGVTMLSFMGIGLACDYRIATLDTVFDNDNTWMLDIPPGLGLLYLLPAYVGLGRAQSLATMTEPMDAEKALAWGLLNQTVEAETLDAALEAQSQHMSVYSAETLGTIKALLNVHLPDFKEFFMLESKGIGRAFGREPWKRFPE